jgi:hypothetical protein
VELTEELKEQYAKELKGDNLQNSEGVQADVDVRSFYPSTLGVNALMVVRFNGWGNALSIRKRVPRPPVGKSPWSHGVILMPQHSEELGEDLARLAREVMGGK